MRAKLILAGITTAGCLLLARLVSPPVDAGAALPVPPHPGAAQAIAPAATISALFNSERPAPTIVGSRAGRATPTIIAIATAAPPTLAPSPTPVAIAMAAPAHMPPISVPADVPPPISVPAVPPESPADQPLVAGAINGVPLQEVIGLSPEVQEHVAEVFAEGQRQGRDAGAFSKVGDSTMVFPPLLAAFANPAGYNLAHFGALQATIDHYAGSFDRRSAAAKKGMHTWTEFSPAWITGDECRPSEGPLACELRAHNAAVAIIRLGANEAHQPDEFEKHMRRIVETCLSEGVIPVLGTKPDRLEGPDNTINKIVYRLAEEYRVPLWDYDLIAATVPARGLVSDGVHFRAGGPRDYDDAAAYGWGDSLEDLTALMMLDAVRQAVEE